MAEQQLFKRRLVTPGRESAQQLPVGFAICRESIDDAAKNAEAAEALGFQVIRFRSASQLEQELRQLRIL